MYYVNEYEVGKAYGGPEEGGWWYNIGTFIKYHDIVADALEAEHIKQSLEGYINKKNEGKYETSSVLNKNDWTDIYIEMEPGADFPDQRPHYE